MKRKLPVFLEALVVSLLCAWSAVGCLASAFSMKLSTQELVLVVWLLWAVLCALLLFHRWGGAVVLALAAVGALWLWRDSTFGTQTLSMLGTIVKAYDSGYGIGVPEVLQVEPTVVDLPMAVIGMAVIFAVCRTVCRRSGSLLPVLLLLICLAVCLVMTDTVPDSQYLFGMLLMACLLLLTDSVRRENGIQAGRLGAVAAIPVGLALAALFYFYPRESYINTTQALRENIMQTVMEFPQNLQSQGMSLISGLKSRERVELSTLPTQLLLGTPVAEVTATQDGTVYLRVQDYDVYTGTAWESSSGRQDTLTGSGEELGTVRVNVLSTQSSLLLPAFPDGQVFLQDGAAENTEGSQDSTFLMREFSLAAYPGDEWLTLPENTGSRARALIQAAAIETDSIEQTVASIAELVRNSAVYDRSGTTMDGEEEDFALWFLTEGEQGYCVHFATAAVVLLRSAGIPARYVTGYRVEAKAGQTVEVTSDDAHAWVEYYNYRTWGWYVLEATPTDAEGETEPAQTVPTEGAEPATQPSAVTVPTEATTATTQEESQTQQRQWQIPLWVPITVLTVAGLALLNELQRLLRIELRRRRQRRGTPNQRAVAYDQELRLLARLTHRPIPEVMQELTEKAVFSQHTLNQKELGAYVACQSAYRRRLRREPWWKKLVYHYIYCVI